MPAQLQGRNLFQDPLTMSEIQKFQHNALDPLLQYQRELPSKAIESFENWVSSFDLEDIKMGALPSMDEIDAGLSSISDRLQGQSADPRFSGLRFEGRFNRENFANRFTPLGKTY